MHVLPLSCAAETQGWAVVVSQLLLVLLLVLVEFESLGIWQASSLQQQGPPPLTNGTSAQAC
jgi:hypothetical protein